MTKDEDHETDAVICGLIAEESNRLMEKTGNMAVMFNLLIGILACNIVTAKNLTGANVLPETIRGLKKAVKEFEARPLRIMSIGKEQANERYN
jgi:hypothetical protein